MHIYSTYQWNDKLTIPWMLQHATNMKTNPDLGLHYAWFLPLVVPGIPIRSYWTGKLQLSPTMASKIQRLEPQGHHFQTLAMILHNK